MAQTSFTPANYLVGNLDPMEPRSVFSLANPLRAQVTNLEYNGITTDGSYSLTVTGTDGSSATSTPFVASSNTAAQICAGIVAGCFTSPAFAGLIADAEVLTTDNVALTFAARGIVYTVLANVPGSSPTQSNTTTAGYTEVHPGQILQADGAGGFTTSYSDASLALGVVARGCDLVQPLTHSGVSGYTGPCTMPVAKLGVMPVNVASGITVLRGQKVYFNGTTRTWSNVTTGSHVLVEGAQWNTTGTGIQKVWFKLPSET